MYPTEQDPLSKPISTTSKPTALGFFFSAVIGVVIVGAVASIRAVSLSMFASLVVGALIAGVTYLVLSELRR
jgi:hypothetical protein